MADESGHAGTAGATPREGEGGTATRPVEILVVDDSAVDRRLAGSLIERTPGWSVAYAADGAEALEAIARRPPALVLTDLQMPNLDGLALVREVQARARELPVILMTGVGSEEIALEALRLGAAHYVPKQSLRADLVATVRQVLSATVADRDRKRLLCCIESRRTTYRLGNDPTLFAPLIARVRAELDELGFGDETARVRLGVALQEALSNALYHGNLEVSSDLRQDDERDFFRLAEERRRQSPYDAREVRVEAELSRRAARFVISDQGPGFDVAILDRPLCPDDLMRIGGRGLLLMRTFMDEVRHNDRGNEITLIKRRAG